MCTYDGMQRCSSHVVLLIDFVGIRCCWKKYTKDFTVLLDTVWYVFTGQIMYVVHTHTHDDDDDGKPIVCSTHFHNVQIKQDQFWFIVIMYLGLSRFAFASNQLFFLSPYFCVPFEFILLRDRVRKKGICSIIIICVVFYGFYIWLATGNNN